MGDKAPINPSRCLSVVKVAKSRGRVLRMTVLEGRYGGGFRPRQLVSLACLLFTVGHVNRLGLTGHGAISNGFVPIFVTGFISKTRTGFIGNGHRDSRTISRH